MSEENKASEGGSPSYPISSVDNALRLLLLFREQQSMRLTDACNYLGVAHSTAHRLLAMLIHRGFVRQDATRAYRPGPMLVDIGLAVVQKMDVRTQARPFLETLATRFGETVHLVTLEGSQVRYLDSVESDRTLRVIARTGQVLPAHCTSAGKALLGEFSPEQVRALYADEALTIKTTRSIKSFAALENALDDVRHQGYATNYEESEEGVGSVAIALVNAADRPVASIAVAVPVTRLLPELQINLVKALKEIRQQFRDLSV
ncbi:IclR family transcriptional regulator [Paramixta manurensis]|uniref:HTH-type transcriptional repressor AllR n=1 Tax=Paramixta manurensis TaxID=2740817 RepID=A0A6M8UHX4_9GAMM|nr:IclR family transcriptional regulator [Erwiniaceae bacterium PD-1]